MAVLELSNIGKSFGKVPALVDVSLSVGSGEFICLLGGSGCGKTTLLRVIAGLEQHDQGEIFLDDKDLNSVPCHERNIGMVFQSLALFPHMNVRDNVAYGQKMRGVAPADRQAHAKQLLEMVGLAGFETREVSSLSGGQRQRVAIARALALKPQLFLMDEPFSALDAGLRDHLQIEIRKLQQTLGITTVFVTHDQREAMALADRIVILNDGKIEQAASPANIYRYPETRFVAEFIGSNNLLDIEVSSESIYFNGHDLGHPPEEIFSGLEGEQTITIRPEAITIHPSKIQLASHVNDANTLPGRITMQRQVGSQIEREIDMSGILIRQTAFQNTSPDLSVGAEVGISWDWSEAWVLPK